MIENWEREYLRDLAKKQLELANGEEMQKKEAHWYAFNDCKTKEPIITLERGTFNKEFESLWEPKCQSEKAQSLEYYFH